MYPFVYINMHLKKFLENYDTVIFDMDGVITNEQNYWNSAALTVWEYLNQNSGKSIDMAYCMEHYQDIHAKVFCDDELIRVLKNKGINSNWDLGYVTVLISWICGGKDNWDNFEAVLGYAENMSDNILDEYEKTARECSEKTGFDYEWLRRCGDMWNEMQLIFQQWFLGDELFCESYGYMPQNSGKPGLLKNEKPIIPLETLKELLKELNSKMRVCMGTGRPGAEILNPLKVWGVLDYFDKNGLCTYDYVEKAQENLNVNNLPKPHPYMFLKALFGLDYPDKKILDGDYDKERIAKTLVVGDAGADILAAKAMGAHFCATLTGVQGKSARGYFEEMEAEYILDSICDFAEC